MLYILAMVKHRINSDGNDEWYSEFTSVCFSHRSGHVQAFDRDGVLYCQADGGWYACVDGIAEYLTDVGTWQDVVLGPDGKPVWSDRITFVQHLIDDRRWHSWFTGQPSCPSELIPIVEMTGNDRAERWCLQLYGMDGKLKHSFMRSEAFREALWTGQDWLFQFDGANDWDQRYSESGNYLGAVYRQQIDHTCANGRNWAAGAWIEPSRSEHWLLYNGNKNRRLNEHEKRASFGHGAIANDGTLIYTRWLPDISDNKIKGIDDSLRLYDSKTGMHTLIATNRTPLRAQAANSFLGRGRPAISYDGTRWAWHRPTADGRVYVESGRIETQPDETDELEKLKAENIRLKDELQSWTDWYKKAPAARG